MKNFTLSVLIFICSFSLSFAEDSTPEKIIEAQVGQEFRIALESNATTGYQWQFKEPLNETMFKLVNSDYLVDEKNLIGSGGKQIWVFKALKDGETKIFFQYLRSWEKDQPPAKEETFLINISE